MGRLRLVLAETDDAVQRVRNPRTRLKPPIINVPLWTGNFRFVAGSPWRVVLLLVVLAAGLAASANAADKSPSEPRRLRVSTAVDHFPYSFRDEPGHLTGFAVEVFDAVARAMSLSFERVELTALEDLRRFNSGEFDVAQFHALPSGAGGRAEFSAPVLVVHGTIFVRKGDGRFKSMEDVREKKARIATPAIGHAFALAQGLDATLLTMTSSPECLRMLSVGDVDAILLARLTGQAQARRLGIRNVEAVGPSLDGFTVTYCLAVHPGDGELLARINEGLAVLHQTGEFEQLHEKWFSRYQPLGLTREQMIAYVAGALAVALVLVLWALLRQRELRRRLAHQAAELDESRSVLAEAQHFARLGHWQRARDRAIETLWSDETYRIFERDPQAGPPSPDELIQLAIPSQRAQWREALERTMREGGSYDCDIVIEPRPGFRKTIHTRGRERLDADGRRIGLFGTVQDVTAWRTAEAALRQSEQLLRALYDNLPLALGVVEKAGDDWVFVSLNPEGMRRLAPSLDSPVGRAINAIGLASERAGFWHANFDRCIESTLTFKVEMQAAEERRDYAVAFVPLGRDGDRARCCFLMEDITDRKAKDEEISRGRRLRAIGELVGGIAHEFNNLLTPVLLKSDMLRAEWAHLPGLQDELRVIADAARRSAALTRRLLTFGRSSDRRPEVLELPGIVAANVDLLRDTIDRRIGITANVPDDLPPVFLNSGDLHQIILNLLLNARDTLTQRLARENPPGWSARISIDAQALPANAVVPFAPRAGSTAEAWVRLTVRDDGEGMVPDVLERIFEPFYTTKEVGQGTGLGLATVWHLVTEVGGRIDVESIVGEGSAFHVSLPVREKPAQIAPIAANGSSGLANTGCRRRMLVVDDEEAISQLVAKVLRRQGHEVVLVSNGLDAWSKLSAEPEGFDFILMDLNMPGLSGLELARRARALPCECPLVVMSGRVSDDERAEMARLKVDAILGKPFDIDTLLTTIASVIEAEEK